MPIAAVVHAKRQLPNSSLPSARGKVDGPRGLCQRRFCIRPKVERGEHETVNMAEAMKVFGQCLVVVSLDYLFSLAVFADIVGAAGGVLAVDIRDDDSDDYAVRHGSVFIEESKKVFQEYRYGAGGNAP